MKYLISLSRHWLFQFLLVSALWGVSFLFQRVAISDFGAMPLAFIRVGSAAIFLLFFVWIKQENIFEDLFKNYLPIMVVGLTNAVIPFGLYAYALQYINSGFAGVLNSAVPLFSMVLAWIWFKDKPDVSRLLGLFLGFFAIVMLAVGGTGFSFDATTGAILACLVATFFYGFAAVYTQRYLKNVSSLAVAVGSQVVASLILLIPAIFFWPERFPSVASWMSSVVGLGVMSTAVAFVLFYNLIGKIGSSRTTLITFLIPVFSLAAGYVFLGEVITLTMLVWSGVVLISASLAIGMWRIF
jgi:drug/metabolite transporter (DMT)-like permease